MAAPAPTYGGTAWTRGHAPNDGRHVAPGRLTSVPGPREARRRLVPGQPGPTSPCQRGYRTRPPEISGGRARRSPGKRAERQGSGPGRSRTPAWLAAGHGGQRHLPQAAAEGPDQELRVRAVDLQDPCRAWPAGPSRPGTSAAASGAPARRPAGRGPRTRRGRSPRRWRCSRGRRRHSRSARSAGCRSRWSRWHRRRWSRTGASRHLRCGSRRRRPRRGSRWPGRPRSSSPTAAAGPVICVQVWPASVVFHT